MNKILPKSAAILILALLIFPIISVQAQNETDILAGTGSAGMQDGVYASFNAPRGIVVLPGGEVLVADSRNNLLRLISNEGDTTTYAGTVFGVTSFSRHRDDVLNVAALHRPMGLARHEHGWIFVADSANNSIRVIIGSRIYTLAGWGEPGFSDGAWGYSAFNNPSAVAVGPCGNVFVADTLNHVIRMVTLNGYTTTIAGTPTRYGYQNGDALNTLFDSPSGIAVDASGRIFVADTGNHVIRVIENGEVRTLAGSPMLYQYNGESLFLGGFADGQGSLAQFNHPMGINLWGAYLVVADSANHSIRLLTHEGEVTTLAGGAISEDAGFLGLSFPVGVYAHGDRLYVADSGSNTIRALMLGDR